MKQRPKMNPERSTRVTQSEIARRAGLDVSSVNKILNRRPGSVFTPETVERVLRLARELGYDFGQLKYTHRREHPRKEVAFRAELAIYLGDGTLYDYGAATVSELSLSGARLKDLVLAGCTLPVAPFTVRLKFKGDDPFEVDGRIVRLGHTGGFSVGVRFSGVDPPIRARLKRVAKLVD